MHQRRALAQQRNECDKTVELVWRNDEGHLMRGRFL